jgi:hypothetical protein
MYQTTTPVKYWQIFHELLEKNEFTETEIGNICEDLYRQELLTAMGLLNLDSTIEGTWQTPIQELKTQLSKFSEFTPLFEQNREFTYFFSWDLFHLFHPIVAEYLTTGFCSHQKITELTQKYDTLFGSKTT